MFPAFNIFIVICVENLGSDTVFSHNVQQRVIDDILLKEFLEKGGIINRIIYKYRRWKSNG